MKHLKRLSIRSVFCVLLVLFVFNVHAIVIAQEWVASWGSSLQGVSPEDWSLTDASIRLIARSSLSGDRVRIRLENTYGQEALQIKKASIGIQNITASLVEGSLREIRFEGSVGVKIDAGNYVLSDPIALSVQAEQSLAVTLYISDADVRSSIHRGAITTSYITDMGAVDRTANVDGEPYVLTTTSMHWLSAVEVFSSSAAGAIVAFGDSITDGSCATVDGHDRWEDVLHTRLFESMNSPRLGMINAGIGGNTAIRVPPVTSTPAVERMDRDVLNLSGITHLIVFLGTNDLRRGATTQQVIEGLQEIITRGKSKGLKVIAATIIPRNPLPRRGLPADLGFGDEENARRHSINEWIRQNDVLDAVLDFDLVVKDAGNMDLIDPNYDCDGIHPNIFGYAAMGRSIDLQIFN